MTGAEARTLQLRNFQTTQMLPPDSYTEKSGLSVTSWPTECAA
jgi:hypothetical protein